jgi:hypothetical protein
MSTFLAQVLVQVLVCPPAERPKFRHILLDSEDLLVRCRSDALLERLFTP